MLSDIKKFIQTSRPLYWLVHFLFFVFGVFASGNFRGMSDPQFLIPLFMLTLPYSYFVYAANDYYDDESDHANKRKGGVFGRVHNKNERKELLFPAAVCFILCGICFSFFGLPALLMYFLLSADLFWYSAMPLRFKRFPIIDFITGGSLYGGLMYLLGYVSFGGNLQALFENFPINLLFILVITAVYHMVLAIFDVKADKKQGITTTPAVFGERNTLFLCILLMMSTLPFFYSKSNFFVDILVRSFFCVLLFQPKLRENKIMQKIIGEYSLYLSFVLTLLAILLSPSAIH